MITNLLKLENLQSAVTIAKKIFFELKPVPRDRGDSGDHFALVDDLPSPKGTHVMNVLNSANFAENYHNIRVSMTS